MSVIIEIIVKEYKFYMKFNKDMFFFKELIVIKEDSFFKRKV